MLAGLLFANEEAPGAGGRLVATLPFAGGTLIEHQARQLAAAGAGQIVVVASDPTPELQGALHRIGRHRMAVDPVHGLAEARGKLHPLARVVMLADGLVAADETIAALAGDRTTDGEALLVVAGAAAPPGFERIGGADAWAGIARLGTTRIGEGAALPADYDPQSTLLRLAESAGATRLVLPATALAAGHGIEREAGLLERRGRRVIASAVAARHGWFDRWIAGPAARAAMPTAAAQGLSGVAVLTAAMGLALVGAVLLLLDWPRLGLILVLAAGVASVVAATLAMLSEERIVAITADAARSVAPVAALLLLGWRTAVRFGDGVPLVLAIVAAGAGVLAERAARGRRRWWGSPPAYTLVTLAMLLPGWPRAAVLVAALYAAATLASAIEDRRAADDRADQDG